MKCPHCLVDFYDNPDAIPIGTDSTGSWGLLSRKCPNCGLLVLELAQGQIVARTGGRAFTAFRNEVLIRPRSISRTPISPDVPDDVAEDYKEACLVLADSPKASAALSRRCLQQLLRQAAKVKPGNLANEIQQALDTGHLPSHLADSIDAIRNIGNFAAHPTKSTNTGEAIPVEPGEAEWNLDVLEALFDFYYVQPAIIKKKRDALNNKLVEAGKAPMK